MNKYMNRAIDVAQRNKKDLGHTPRESVLVVQNEQVVFESNQIQELLLNSYPFATFYFPYEPTPTDGLVRWFAKQQNSHIVIGSRNIDFPTVFAKSVSQKGVKIDWIMEEGCDKLNEVYRHGLEHHRPFVTLSWGMSLDGKIATTTGDSKYISGSESRRFVHQLRTEHEAILVGINTVLQDDPLLTVRLASGRNPHRIILDSDLRFPLDAQMLSIKDGYSKTIIVTSQREELSKKSLLQSKGATIIEVNKKGDYLDLSSLMTQLYEIGVHSLLVEGGGTVHFSFLKEGFVQRIYATVSPLLIGGTNAKTSVSGQGFATLGEAFRLKPFIVHQLGDDIILESTPIKA